MSLRRVRKKVDYAKFCEDEDGSTNNSDGKFILIKVSCRFDSKLKFIWAY